MEKLLEFLIKSIVNHPQEVVINQSDQDDFLNLAIKANPEDIKIIIGRAGRTIRAIRNLLRLVAIKQGKKVNLTIQE